MGSGAPGNPKIHNKTTMYKKSKAYFTSAQKETL